MKTGVHLRRLLGLAQLYGAAELLSAISRALELAAYDAAYVENLLLAAATTTTPSHAHSAHSQAARIDRRDPIGSRRSRLLRPLLHRHRGELSWHDVMTISRHGWIVTWPS